MSDTAIVLAIIALSLIATLSWMIESHRRERREWAVERKQLVDRAIARHAGEVLALDREPKPRSEHSEAHQFEGIEGLS